ncbi:MAG: hypothetical protein WAX89_04345 [Alphaproteobacteria bacterium]
MLKLVRILALLGAAVVTAVLVVDGTLAKALTDLTPDPKLQGLAVAAAMVALFWFAGGFSGRTEALTAEHIRAAIADELDARADDALSLGDVKGVIADHYRQQRLQVDNLAALVNEMAEKDTGAPSADEVSASLLSRLAGLQAFDTSRIKAAADALKHYGAIDWDDIPDVPTERLQELAKAGEVLRNVRLDGLAVQLGQATALVEAMQRLNAVGGVRNEHLASLKLLADVVQQVAFIASKLGDASKLEQHVRPAVAATIAIAEMAYDKADVLDEVRPTIDNLMGVSHGVVQLGIAVPADMRAILAKVEPLLQLLESLSKAPSAEQARTKLAELTRVAATVAVPPAANGAMTMR